MEFPLSNISDSLGICSGNYFPEADSLHRSLCTAGREQYMEIADRGQNCGMKPLWLSLWGAHSGKKVKDRCTEIETRLCKIQDSIFLTRTHR